MVKASSTTMSTRHVAELEKYITDSFRLCSPPKPLKRGSWPPDSDKKHYGWCLGLMDFGNLDYFQWLIRLRISVNVHHLFGLLRVLFQEIPVDRLCFSTSMCIFHTRNYFRCDFYLYSQFYSMRIVESSIYNKFPFTAYLT